MSGYPREKPARNLVDCGYSFGVYLRSRLGFVVGAIALAVVIAGIMVITGSNASSVALVLVCEALFACAALAAGYLRDREFYQQLSLFCDSPENARFLSSILNEPRTLEGSIAYRALAVQGKAASDELSARSRDMKEYRDYIELWVHEAKTPIASAQLALASLHGPEIGKVRGDLDRVESRVEQALLVPLACVGVPVGDIALVLSLALRFIPMVFEELARIRDAQASRGANLSLGPVVNRVRAWGAVFVPLFVGLFRRADRIAIAMDSRCYCAAGSTVKRTSLSACAFSALSFAQLSAGIVLFVVVALLL